VGHSRVTRLDWILYVHPERYGTLPENARHEVARAIGEVNRFEKVDRAANARQDEDRRKLTTAELMRGQNTIRI
jgi:hypothetical protein